MKVPVCISCISAADTRNEGGLKKTIRKTASVKSTSDLNAALFYRKTKKNADSDRAKFFIHPLYNILYQTERYHEISERGERGQDGNCVKIETGV